MHTLRRLVGGTLLVALLLLGGTAARVWQFAKHQDTSHSDCIVVMGAAQYNGTPTRWFAARLDQAAAMYRDGVAPTIVTLGGKQEGDVYTEGEAGKKYLEDQGIPANAIVAVGQGADTLSSAQAFSEVARAQGWESTVVVTDPWHALRARTMLRDFGYTVHSAPTRHGPAISRSSEASGIIHETFGLLYYRLTHISNLLDTSLPEDF